MDRGSTEVEIHCACVFAKTRLVWRTNTDSFNSAFMYRTYEWEQTAWCRLHMEAEIAKQGQAAGVDKAQGSESPASPAKRNVVPTVPVNQQPRGNIRDPLMNV